MGWIDKISRVGRIVERAAAAPLPAMKPPAGVRGSLEIRQVDAGSYNGCEVQISGAFGPVYDAERFRARLVASPRHGDALLVTGVVTRNMADPLRTTVDATPRPRRVIACGDCALNRGVFRDAYGCGGRSGVCRCGNPGVPADPDPDHRGAAIGDRQVTAALAASAAPAPNLMPRNDFGSALTSVLTCSAASDQRLSNVGAFGLSQRVRGTQSSAPGRNQESGT